MQIKMHNFACECKRHTKTVPVKLGGCAKTWQKVGYDSLTILSQRSRNPLEKTGN